ncbi:DUF3618 domain-containing protein [Pseudoclavibacter endophyticus]|uniref:DUF3618 domain-containing protein n=2 Tax=Pseudoclavibacter endophyticus TaxID=1778590 RepID=A0A6H9WHJ5_9MICO|nr:DUF3618 domain-containing protein [Pseudoclavibacter endophyticus]
MKSEKADEPKPEKAKDTRSDSDLGHDIERVRDELAQTLDALEYKLDLRARGQEYLEATKRRLAKQWDDNPLLVGGIAAGGVLALAGALVGGVVLARRGR